MMIGRIIKLVSNQYTVLLEDKRQVKALAMGKVRLDKAPIAGDFVAIEELEEHWVIQEIQPRFNELSRPSIANVDQALIMMSTTAPKFAPGLVDRMIFLVSLENIKPILFVTKMDLVSKNDPVHDLIADYKDAGYNVVEFGKDRDVPDLTYLFKDKVSVLTGNSGVGKSTLLNRIDPTLQIRTQETSIALGRGKHTTTHTQLHEIYGGLIADTPGFSTLDFSQVEPLDLALSIPDFQIDKPCRFRNCIHQNEPGCAIKEAVKQNRVSSIRYQNYLEVLESIE
ncbi:MAG: ribosome small subunit-dependent GTPase A [Erysipelothrix sp.]|nr:ribosome small subunit-dependent GTPase A [Erysipelothrix sp.]